MVSIFVATTAVPSLGQLAGNSPLATQKVSAATASTINFQARLQNAAGNIAPDGSYNVEFKLYNVSSGGSALWTEDYLNSSSQGVSVANGYLTVNLGSVTSFPGTIKWDQDLWLTMTVRGTGSCAFAACTPADAEMSPRLKLTSVPYAFKAGQLAQYDTGSGFTSSLKLATTTTGGDQIFQLQDQGAGGTYNLLTSGSGIQNQNASAQTSSNFWISGTGKADTFNATTALQTAGVTRIDASGNLTNIGNTSASGTLQYSGTTGSSYIMSSLGLGTTSPQAGSALTIANGQWLSAVDSSGTGYINMFQVNSSNEIQVGAALNIDGGIILPTDGGQMTFSDLPISTSTTAGTAESYTLRVGSANVLTIYGEADGSGNAQNTRVAIGSSIAPAYTLDVGGDINSSSGYRVSGTLVCTSSGCTPAAGSGSYIQNTTSAQSGANFNISGNGVIGGTLSVTGVITGNGSGLTTLNASNLSSGTVADARLNPSVLIDRGVVADGTDWDTITSQGTYRVGTTAFGTMTNYPVGSFGFGTLVVNTAGSSITQNYYPNNNASGVFTRTKYTTFSTWSQIYTSTSDGSGSGLDADLLDGNSSAFFQNATNLTSGTVNTARVSGSYTGITAVGTLTSLTVSGAIQSSLFDTASAGTLSIGTTNATGISLNKNVTVAAGQYLSLVGGITSSRPASPTEGMVYFDTTTKQLLVYANGKWQADRSRDNKMVSMGTAAGCSGTSPVASQNADSADYVITSCTSAQTTINTAIGALPTNGGTVYLMEGTYIIDGQINVPSNVTLTGAGPTTRIVVKDGVNANLDAIAIGTTSQRVTISNLRLSGNATNNSAGTQNGIIGSTVGSGTGTTATMGALISGVTVEDFRSNGLNITSAQNTQITTNIFRNNSIVAGFSNLVIAGSDLTVTGNLAVGSGGNSVSIAGNKVNVTNNIITGGASGYSGLAVTGSYNTITANVIDANLGGGVGFQSTAAYNTFSGNTITGNSSSGIALGGTVSNNTISNNKVYDNAGSGSASSISLTTTGSANSVINNNIVDTAGTGFAISIASGTVNTVLGGNTYSGTGAASISDSSTTAIYNGQQDSNGYFLFKSATSRLGIGNVSPAYALDVTGDINSTTGFRFNGTAGSTVTCSGGQVLQNTVVQGGIITSGTCASAGVGTFVSLQGATPGSPDTGNLNISGTAIANNIQGTTKVLSALFDTVSASTLNLGTTTANAITLGSAGADTTVAGNLTINKTLTMTGSVTSGANAKIVNTGTLTSSSTGSQYGIQNQVSFSPSGASVGTIHGMVNIASISGSALNIAAVYGTASRVDTTSGYTGTITSASGYFANDPSIATIGKVTNYTGFDVGQWNANTGNTTGTLNNYGVRVQSNTNAAATGGTMNNYGINVTMPSGSSTGTTNNYGLYIQGAGAGSANYSLYDASSANSLFTGNVGFGGNTAANYAVDATGSINASTGYRVGGTAGSAVTCSGGNVLSNIVITGGIVTGGSCATNGGGISPTLQNGYDNAGTTNPQIQLSGTNGGLKMRDASTTVGNIFQIQNSAATATYFNVTNAGIQTTGLSATGSALFQNTANSTTALVVNNAAGSSLLTVDSSTPIVSIGGTSDFTSSTYLTTAPDTQPASDGRGVEWSQSGTYVATAHSTTPFMSVYKRSGDTLTKLANPATLPASTGNDAAWSPDSTYLSIAHSASPFVSIYKRSGDTLTKLTNPATLPTGNGFGVDWSPDGQYMSVAHATSPYITIYKRSGDTFTKLADPTNLPNNTANGVSWSPDGQYMSVAYSTSPYIIIYKRSGDTFTKLADPATLPTGIANGVDWSPDGNYMTVAHTTTPFITIYQRSGDTFTKQTNPATLPTNTARDVKWSPDGRYMAVGHFSSPYVTIYAQSGATFTKQTNPSSLPTDNVYGVAWSPTGQFLSIVQNAISGTVLGLYKTGGSVADLSVSGALTVGGNTTLTQLTAANGIVSNSLVVGNSFVVQSAANVAMLQVDSTANKITLATDTDINGNITVASGKTMALQGATSISTTNASALLIQNGSSVSLFKADTSAMTITIGSSGNTITLSNTGLVLAGNARNGRTLRMSAEYPGAVLDAGTGSNNTGTMTSGIDLTNRMNYYKWTTTQASNQSYDIDVQVPIPKEFDSWGTNPLNFTGWTSNTTNGTILLEARDSTNTVICNFVSVTPGSTSTWATNNTACTLSSGTYTVGDYMTLRIRLQSPQNGDVRAGMISLTYLTKN